jgi:hypothetical protein
MMFVTLIPHMSLSSYLKELRSNPSIIPNGASAQEVVAHAKSLGHDVTEDDIKVFANKGKKDLDSAGGGSCYAQNDDAACGI